MGKKKSREIPPALEGYSDATMAILIFPFANDRRMGNQALMPLVYQANVCGKSSQCGFKWQLVGPCGPAWTEATRKGPLTGRYTLCKARGEQSKTTSAHKLALAPMDLWG